MSQQAPNNPKSIVTRKAGAAISAYRILKPGTSDDEVIHATAASDALIGVSRPASGIDLSDLVATGGPVDMATEGIAHVEYGGNVTIGDRLTATTDGKAIVTTTQGQRIIGQAMMSGVDGDVGSVQISPGTI
jgi:guanyl-specific ribonuclease Sa